MRKNVNPLALLLLNLAGCAGNNNNNLPGNDENGRPTKGSDPVVLNVHVGSTDTIDPALNLPLTALP